MDPVRTRALIRFTAATAALGLVVAGCSKGDASASSSSTTSSASSSSASSSASATSSATSAEVTTEAAPDYESLLVKPEAIPEIPTGPWVGDTPKVTDNPPPPDVSQTFTSGTNAINSTILIVDDAAGAAVALGGAASSVPSQVTGSPVPAPSVSPDATITIGTSPDGTTAMAALLFTEENAVAIMVFGGAPGDLEPVPQDFIEEVGKAQLAAIQEGLPELG